MKKTSLVIGVILSLAVHALLVVLARGSPSPPPAPPVVPVVAPEPEETPPPTMVVTAPVVDREPPPETPREPPPELPELETPDIEAVEELAPAPDVPALADLPRREPAPELAPVREPEPAPELTPVAAEAPVEIDADETLPPLRITWGSTGELRRVAGQLGMRIVAVDGLGEVLGEVARDGLLRIEPFDGSFADYSNRVRTLPRRYFGTNMTTVGNRSVSSFWILVPVALDRQMTDTVRHALEKAGKSPRDVRWVEAAFARGPKLVVTKIHAR